MLETFQEDVSCTNVGTRILCLPSIGVDPTRVPEEKKTLDKDLMVRGNRASRRQTAADLPDELSEREDGLR